VFCTVPPEQRTAKFSVVPAHRLECHSKHFDPFLRVELCGVEVAGQPDPIGIILSQNKNTLGSNLTVSDGAGS
jgi:hypothetical protein